MMRHDAPDAVRARRRRRRRRTRAAAAALAVVVAGACAPLADAQIDTQIDDDATPDDDTPADDTAADGAHVDPSCTTNGCLRGLLHVARVSRTELQALVQPGVVVDNGYDVWMYEAATDGATSTGTLTTPIDLAVPADGFDVVVNNHGTVGIDDACRLSGTIAGAALAGLFGARGAIGVAPDHPGLGTPGLQPYLVSRVEGRSALDAARAALQAASVLGVATSGRVAIVGMSQGGHATLAAAQEHAAYAPELDVRAFAAAAPASMFLEHWQAGAAVAGPHLVFHALLAASWAAYAGTSTAGVFAAGFDERVLRTRCTFDPSFGDAPGLADAVPQDPEALFSPAWRAAFSSGDFSAFAWVSDGFADNRLRPFTQTAPVAIFQGTDDAVVLPAHTQALVEALRAGGNDVELHVVAGATHIDTAFGFVGSHEGATDESIAWVRAALARD